MRRRKGNQNLIGLSITVRFVVFCFFLLILLLKEVSYDCGIAPFPLCIYFGHGA